MKKYRWALPGWLLMLTAIVAPQAVSIATGWFVLAVVAALVPLAGLGYLLLRVAPTLTAALVAFGFAAALTCGFAALGSDPLQEAALLTMGRSLDGVPGAEALRHKQANTWVRLTDARIRVEETQSVTLVSGGGTSNRPTAQTRSTTTLAPLSFNGVVERSHPLWACGPEGWLKDWEGPVRGALRPVDDDVADHLRGATAEPWCIHLDHRATADLARDNALAGALSFLLMFPLMVLGMMLIAIHAKAKR